MNTARELTNDLIRLHRNERHAMADFLVALAAFDERKLYRELGHASLFSFLTIELKLSAGAAQYRKTAAQLVQRFPEVDAALRDGRLCFSAVVQVAKVLTPENSAEVLPRFFGLSARDAAVVAVSIRPVENPPQRTVLILPRPVGKPADAEVRAIEAPAPLLALRTSEVPAADVAPPSLPVEPSAPAPAAVRATPPLKPSTVEPLDDDQGRLHLNVSRRFLRKLQDAKNAESHARPCATEEEILEIALDALLLRRAKKKGLAVKPRSTPRPSSPNTVTAEQTRVLMARAEGRCEWRFESGERCGSSVRIEVDHVVPRAHGGPTTLENLRVLCRGHNDLAARQAFGDTWMDGFTGPGRRPRRRLTR